MNFFRKLGIDPTQASIDWDLKPAETFGIFESWGGKERVKNKNDRFYYFYIDNWQPPARLNLMERGIKYARILARIEAPQELIDNCIADQGKSTTLDASYSIDDAMKLWLQKNIVDSGDDSLVIPIQVEDRYVNPAVVPDYGKTDFTQTTPAEYLLKVAPLQEVEHTVQARMPTSRIKKLLHLKENEPCLVLLRRTWSKGKIASIATLYHPGDRYELSDHFRL